MGTSTTASALDRNAADAVLRKAATRYGRTAEADVALLDALEGCVRPAPAQALDRDAANMEMTADWLRSVAHLVVQSRHDEARYLIFVAMDDCVRATPEGR